ncbi:MAG TPA: alkaline phosphatase family protein [Actinomycetota bacterium]|nr:alkaline phosphatase family protein [Actinomycetota bacterium]
MRTPGRPWRAWIGAATGMLVLAALSTTQLGTPAAGAAGPPQLDHIFTIVMENHNYASILGNTAQAPYTNSLINEYSAAANYAGVAHPSLPNYLALTGGSTFGVTTDCTDCFVTATSIADRITASGRTWKSYEESMPTPCFVGDAYPYAQKHDPFIYFNDIRTSAECNNIVPFGALASDLASASTTPNYAFITPNLCNDTHDCPVATGDQWLSQNVPAILQSPAFTQQKSVLFITYDEDENGANQVLTLVITNSAVNVPTGYRSGVAYNHYSLLKTVEWAWGLAPLTANDAAAAPMADFFGAAPLSPAPTPTPPPSPAPTPSPTPSSAPPPPAGNNGYEISLSASTTAAATGQSVNLTGTANLDVGPTPYGLSIIDTTTGQEMAHVQSGSVVAASVSQSAATTHSFVAMVCNRGGANAQASSSPVAITWS